MNNMKKGQLLLSYGPSCVVSIEFSIFGSKTLILCSIEGTFLPWSADLRKHLLSLYPLPEGVTPIPQEVFIPPKHQLSLAEGAAPVASSDGSTISRNGPNASEQPQNKSSSLNLTQTETTSSRSAEDLDMAFPLKLRLPIDHQPEFCPQLKEPAPDHTPIVDSTLPSYDLLPIKDAFPLRLLENRRITPDAHWQDVRLLTFITYECHTYQPGDAITIYPKNFPEDVQALIDLMEWNEVADKNLAFEATAPDFFHADNLVMKPHGMYPLPKTTLRQLLMHNLDITAIPKRTFFDNMAHYTENQMHKERLLEFSNPAFTDEFFDYTTRPRRSILEVLQDFPSVKLPWKYATSLFPLIRGRQYSIASGGIQQVDPKQPEFRKFEILVALVRYKTILRKVRQGLCSRYLASLEEGKAIRVTMTKNDTFYQQAREKGDCIMIAPGTGVAPCRSLIWERAMHWFDKPDHVGKVYLFFGNRNEKADYFFKDEWKAASLRVEVFTAFSRDQPEKIYIQDIIRREKKLILDLMERGPIIYICGSSGSMPKQVRQALIDIWAEGMEEKFGEIAARKMAEITMQEYEKKGGIIQETW